MLRRHNVGPSFEKRLQHGCEQHDVRAVVAMHDVQITRVFTVTVVIGGSNMRRMNGAKRVSQAVSAGHHE